MLDQLQDILAHMDAAWIADLRDSVALALPWYGALRGAEAFALDYRRAGPEHDGANAGYIEIEPEGANITLTRSKDSPTEPVSIAIPAIWAQQALDWLSRWAARADLAPGSPMLRPLTRGGRVLLERLQAPAITAIVCRRRMYAAALKLGTPEEEAPTPEEIEARSRPPLRREEIAARMKDIYTEEHAFLFGCGVD